MWALPARGNPGLRRTRAVAVGKCCGRIPGRATRRDLPDARSPALQPAPALIGARGRPASSPAPPSQSGPPELGLSRGVGGDAAAWRLSRPPRGVPAGPPQTEAPGAGCAPPTLRPAPRRAPDRASFSSRSRTVALRLAWLGRAPTAPGATRRRRLSEAGQRAPALAHSPASEPARGWVGRAQGSRAEAGCSRPSPTRCHPRRPWSRLTRMHWTSAPKCSSTVCCGSGPSGGRQPSGPGGKCVSCARWGLPGEGA